MHWDERCDCGVKTVTIQYFACYGSFADGRLRNE